MDLSNLLIISLGLIFVIFTQSGQAKLMCMSCSSLGRTPHFCSNSIDLSNVTYVECSYTYVRAFIQSVNSAQSQLNNRFGNTLGYEPHDNPREYACVKTVLDGNNKGAEPVVIRGCVEKKKEGLDACRRLREDSGNKFTLHHCEECATDKCNGGSAATPGTLGAILLSTLAVLYLSRAG